MIIPGYNRGIKGLLTGRTYGRNSVEDLIQPGGSTNTQIGIDLFSFPFLLKVLF